ncbi:MAG: amino acid adenylation domain-containing protein [Candidatus Eremiobacteraeota bacterium]|nr:amino acid adenylation domain-containing protein [Candidatus Eremiobacteraeota bacterium]
MIVTGCEAPAAPRTLRGSYPLTPLQQGMLFHHLLQPGSGVDIQQIVCSLREAVDVAALEGAWNSVARRHAILATSFRWEGVERACQHVWDAVTVPLRCEDWRSFEPSLRQAKLEAFLYADRLAGFELDAAPLCRVALFRVGDAAYELVWTVHHAVVDGRSFVHVLRDVFAAYEALAAGATPQLGQPPRAFRDFVAWLDERDPKSAAPFWRERLRGFGAATALPVASAARSGVREPRAAPHRETVLSRAATESLRFFAREYDVTLNTLVQGAWAIVLARHSGETDVVFGATRACRHTAIEGARDIVGPFINTLPIRTNVAPDEPLIAWLQRLRAGSLAVREWEHTPLGHVQGWSEIAPGSPLFDSIVVFESRSLEAALRAEGGAWEKRAVRVFGQTNYPLGLEAYGDTELRLRLQFDASRFDGADIERILSQLETLLTAMPGSVPGDTIGELPWMTAAEREVVVARFNATETPYPRDATLPEIFATHVAATPAAVALAYGDRELTYSELDARANQLAQRLSRAGVGPGVPVGMCFERSAEAVIAALAILKAGGTYVPLDPAYPVERLAFMVEDTGLRVVLTLQRWVAALPAGPQTICLDADGASLAAESATAPHCAAHAENAAYIMYTSGSTGTPKGVSVTHRGIVRLVVGATYARFGRDEVLLGFAPLTFDSSTFEMWGALLNGARLAVFAGGAAPTLEDLGATIRAHGVTTLWLTSGLFQQIVEHGAAELRSLRQLLAGGDVLSVPHVRRALEELPNCRFINGYGPTENTTFTTTYTVPRDWNADDRETSVPIGAPIDNTTVYVLDERRAPVPIGVPGRLWTGGDGVAREYHGRPELTAERFVPDPFTPRCGARMYDTGDRARWRPDGTLEFLGRADRQLKIRGFRIEPGEVEAALAAHPSVGGALVVGHGDAAGKRLVAYVVPRAGERVDPPTLAEYLAAELPSYMVPAAIVPLSVFPLTANGKIDRAALPDPGAVAAASARYVAPRSDVERALADVWASVLRAPRVSVTANFFELGGDSILTIALVSRAREAGFRITPRQLYDRPTVAELALVAQSGGNVSLREEPAIDDAPLTPIQRWFFEAEKHELNYWNQAFLFAVPAQLDAPLLAAALGAVIERHDALRLRFECVDGAWRQRVARDAGSVPFETIDLGGVDAAGRPARIEAACVGAQQSLDIAAGPLVRMLHISLGADVPARLFLAVHHLAVDGVSWRLLVEDIEAAYEALRAGASPALRATTPVLRWAQRLAEYTESGGFEAQRQYWRELVAERGSTLPRELGGHAHGLSFEGDAATLGVALDAVETRALVQHVPAAYQTRIDDVLLVALQTALRGWVGDGSMLIDLEGHGREDLFDDVDLSRTVGWFTTVSPVCLELAEQSLRDALRSMKERLRAIPQRGIGYGALRYLGGDDALAVAAQSELVFNYLGQFDAVVAGSRAFAFAPEAYGPWRGPDARRRYALEINALILDGRFEVRWTYDRTRYARETLERVSGDFMRALRELIEHCTSPAAGGYTPSDFPLANLTQNALDALAGDARDIEDIYPLAPIQTLFALFVEPAADPGFEQWRYRVRGPVDVAALRSAWQGVVARHPILRTAFVHAGLPEPLQVVRRDIELPWADVDLRDLSSEERQAALAELLAADRARGFAFERAPLMRVTLVRLSDEVYEFVWSNHHLLLDRWSFPIVLGDVEALYRDLRRGATPALPAAVPYRDYIRSLQAQDDSAAETFWRSALDGLPPPRSFAHGAPVARGDAESGDEARRDLSSGETQALRAFARSHQLSASVVVLGAWALCLSAHTGMADLLLGLAVSGRPADVAGVERLVGVTINNVPLRARVDNDASMLPWLRELAERQLDVQQYSFAPPAAIQRWSGVPWRLRLFENIVVFQNAAADAGACTWLGPEVRIEQAYTPTRTGYPLALIVADGERLSLRIACDGRYFSSDTAGVLLERVHELLVRISASKDATLGTLLATLPAAEATAFGDVAGGAGAPREAFVPPASALEAVLARIWSELLGVADVGATENFFALGGQSLVAMQVVARTRETFSVEIPVRALFANPTVAQFARALSALEQTPGHTERIARVVQRVEAMSPDELAAVSHAD